MRMGVMLALLVLAGPVWAQDTMLDGAQIAAVLTDRTLTYDDGATQVFREGGATVYDNGRASEGRWAVRGDQYCSVWPPSDRWACYDMRASSDGRALTFVAGDGSTTTGRTSQ